MKTKKTSKETSALTLEREIVKNLTQKTGVRAGESSWPPTLRCKNSKSWSWGPWL